MATALEVITAALKEINVLASGETASGDDATDGLAALNRLRDQWAAERLMIYPLGRTTLVLSNATSYPVGPQTPSPAQAWFNMARPMFIDHVGYVVTTTDPDTEYPLRQLTNAEWEQLPQKGLTGSIPTAWWYDATYPNGLLYLWPIPTDSGLTGVIYAPTAGVAFTSLSESVAGPPGWERCMVKNLAIEMLPSYGRQPDPLLMEQARDSKSVVKRSNGTVREMTFPAGALINGRGWYDIRTG